MKPPRIGVIGCGAGGVVIAMARASLTAVVAGFDSDPHAVASARRAGARAGVADRVTFEVAAPGDLLGASYDVIYLLPRALHHRRSERDGPPVTSVGTSVPDP